MSRKDNKVVDFFEPTLTKQSFRDECNINNILAKYINTGQFAHVNARNPRYIDCVGVQDYQAALDLVDATQAQFDALPSKIRARFANDPEQLLAFLDDPKNAAEAAELGLVKTPDSAPTDTSTVSDSPTQ